MSQLHRSLAGSADAVQPGPGALAPARTLLLTYSESALSRTSALKQKDATLSAIWTRTGWFVMALRQRMT